MDIDDEIFINRGFLLEYLYTIRKSKFTIAELSVISGLSESTISNIENFSKDVKLSSIMRYANALGQEIFVRKREV